MQQFALIKIRLRQLGLFREKNLSGFITSFFALSIIAAIYLFVLWWISDSVLTRYSLVLPVAFIFLLLNFHFKRADYHFIRVHFISPVIRMCEEYLFYLLLFCPALLLSGQKLLPFALAPVICVIANLSRSKHSFKTNTYKFRLKFIHSYEWISGMRRFYFSLFALLILSLILISLPVVSLLLCWLLSVVIMQFYFPYEPALLIAQQRKSAERFLYDKTITAFKYSLFLFILPLSGYIFFHPADYQKALMVFVICILNPQIAIIRKYQQYQPKAEFGGNGVVLFLLQLILFNPVVMLLTVLYIVFGYNAALANLKKYCHDHD